MPHLPKKYYMDGTYLFVTALIMPIHTENPVMLYTCIQERFVSNAG
jgi:hypothetical protein